MSIQGSCHCRQTKFFISTPPNDLTECNCSFCSKRGALWAYFTRQEFTLISAESEGIYLWKTKTVKHHFCTHCGCGTYSESPSWSTEGQPDFDNPKIAVNSRLLDDFDLAKLHITKIDGRNGW
jgi:hypothetical protein